MNSAVPRPSVRRQPWGQWLVEVPDGARRDYRHWGEALAAVRSWYASGKLPPLKHLWWGVSKPRSACVIEDCSYCSFIPDSPYDEEHERFNPGHFVVRRPQSEQEPTP